MDKIRPNYTLCFKYKSIGGLKANGGKKIKYLTDSKHKKIKMAVLASAVLCLVTQSYATLCNTMDCCPPGSSVHRDSPGKNTGEGCHALLQVIFPTQRLNPGLPLAGRFFTIWATLEALFLQLNYITHIWVCWNGSISVLYIFILSSLHNKRHIET